MNNIFAVEQSLLTDWLCRTNDLHDGSKPGKEVKQTEVINTLNRINFVNGAVLVHLYRPASKENFLMPVYPEPCLSNVLSCRWPDGNFPLPDLVNYEILHVIIEDGRSMILAPVKLKSVTTDSLSLQLSEENYSLARRRMKRYSCDGVMAELIQKGFRGGGSLTDFNSLGFRIKVDLESSNSVDFFDPETVVTLHLRRDQQILFSGTCRCIRQRGKSQDREVVLAPVHNKITRFKKRRIRNPRQQLVPSPTIIFRHPLTQKSIQMEVHDISTSGFSVYEKAQEGMLIPGMILPELTVTYAGALKMPCSAQVIYRSEEGEKGVRCGLSILDMDITTYTLLTHILSHALDPHSYISNDVDIDVLCEFFFETGFIYPKKYSMLNVDREKFKETYRKIYRQDSEITRHFVYQKNGRIYAHVSMLRAYERAWLIHHHAARIMDGKRVGFMVLKQIMHYLNDVHRLPSAKMDYVMCYFRPEKRFPDRVFGGYARALKNARGCSLDLLSYLPYTTLSLGSKLPKGWSLRECSEHDLTELNRFYGAYSGGLLLDALCLGRCESNAESLEEAYAKLGFFRKLRAYSLLNNGDLNAVLIVNQSEHGLNLSELLNCIKVMVINSEGLPWEVLCTAISELTAEFKIKKIPLLMYPIDYVKDNNIPYERQYYVWILSMQYVNQHIEYIQRKFRIHNE